MKCCHVTCHTVPLMTRPIFHRVFLSACPDTRLLKSSSRFTSSAPRSSPSTSSSHIYKYQPAKWHFLPPAPSAWQEPGALWLGKRASGLLHISGPSHQRPLWRTAGLNNESIWHRIPKNFHLKSLFLHFASLFEFFSFFIHMHRGLSPHSHALTHAPTPVHASSEQNVLPGFLSSLTWLQVSHGFLLFLGCVTAWGFNLFCQSVSITWQQDPGPAWAAGRPPAFFSTRRNFEDFWVQNTKKWHFLSTF